MILAKMEQRNTIEEPATDYATVDTNAGVRAVILLLLSLALSLSLSLALSLLSLD
jgi:hypothetical protein